MAASLASTSQTIASPEGGYSEFPPPCQRSRHHSKDKQRSLLSVVAYDSLPGHQASIRNRATNPNSGRGPGWPRDCLAARVQNPCSHIRVDLHNQFKTLVARTRKVSKAFRLRRSRYAIGHPATAFGPSGKERRVWLPLRLSSGSRRPELARWKQDGSRRHGSNRRGTTSRRCRRGHDGRARWPESPAQATGRESRLTGSMSAGTKAPRLFGVS
ncbi:hypothetical protein ACVWY3_006886 [Bradyrhizobium sp. USDA 4486]